MYQVLNQDRRGSSEKSKKKKTKNRVPGVGLDCTASRPQTQLLDKVKGKGGGGTSPVKVNWWPSHR